MAKPALCAIDVDGTLVGPGKTISSDNFAAIASYIHEGGRVLLASGRMHSSIMRYACELELLPQDLILSYNGAMVRSIEGELLFEHPVPPPAAAEIVDYCVAENLHLNYYYNDILYVQELNAHSQLYLERSGSLSKPVGDLTKLAGCSPTKLLIIDKPARLDTLVPFFKELFGDSLYITKTDDEYLEFMARGVNKGSALADVAKRLGVSQSEIAAFGDSYNDVEMLHWAGLGVAMSNGRDAAKAAADRVVDNSSWSGVGRAISAFA